MDEPLSPMTSCHVAGGKKNHLGRANLQQVLEILKHHGLKYFRILI